MTTDESRAPRRRLVSRFARLMLGLTLYGVSIAMLIQADLGTMPWSVLEVGLARRLDVDLGLVIVVVSFIVLLLWWPLRQRPGFGTLANALWVGPVTTLSLLLVPAPSGFGAQLAMSASAVVVNGLATGLYIGSNFGPGPRDGLMTGVHARTGRSLRLIRTGIEVTVLTIGVLLGGVVGIGTLMYALAIGPLAQFFLRRLSVERPAAAPRPDVHHESGAALAQAE